MNERLRHQLPNNPDLIDDQFAMTDYGMEQSHFDKEPQVEDGPGFNEHGYNTDGNGKVDWTEPKAPAKVDKGLDDRDLSVSEQQDHAWQDYHDNPPQRDLGSLKDEPTTKKKNRVTREEAKRLLAIGELAGGYGASEEARQEATDYIDSRPKSEEDIADSKEEKTYEDMGVKELARELAKAELNYDKTSQSNITDVLFDKLDAVATKQSKNGESASKNFDDEGAKDPADALLDRVMNYKDQAKTELKNDETRSRMDETVTTRWMTELKSQGVPDDILQKFPASFFYKDGDPEQTNDTPQEYLDWLKENSQTQPGNTEDISQDDTQEIPVITGPEPKTKRGLWARVKQAFKKPPAVRFDGKNYKGERVTGKRIGDAIVDERDRKYEGRHYVAIVATGALAVGTAYLMSKVGHDPSGIQAFAEAKLGRSGTQVADTTNTIKLPGSGEHVAPIAEATKFMVESGHGYTDELVDFANSNGINLSGSEAWDLHQHLIDKFGPDYIDINGSGGDIYKQAGDIRLAEPGKATWANGVQSEITKWLNSK